MLIVMASAFLVILSWVIPDGTWSDHAGIGTDIKGPAWVAAIVNAVGTANRCGNESYWNDTVILITWDDWGGWYDHVTPPSIDNMGPGFRVPLIVVSPFAKRGYVSHQVDETASLLTFTEKNFGLPNLGARDATASDLSDCFDYSQKPAPFAAIKTKVSMDTLLHEKPSGLPDND